jgi:hypothetical protein
LKKQMQPKLTIVTASDANYFWGAFILVASIRRNKVPARIHVVHSGYSKRQQRLLEQFGDTHVLEIDGDNPRNFCTRKAEAMLTADTEWISWMDADCMVVGDIAPLILPPNGEFQVRLRSQAETLALYADYYRDGDAPGSIPGWILRQWQQDVGDLAEPRLVESCASNVFVIHQRYRPFLELWNRQILKVIPPVYAEITNKRSPVYLLHDEPVLNSLLAYSSQAPAAGKYLLDDEAGPHVVHFVENPKPWAGWKLKHWNRYERVVGLLEDVHAEGYELPALPLSLDRSKRSVSRALALLEGGKDAAKSVARKLVGR